MDQETKELLEDVKQTISDLKKAHGDDVAKRDAIIKDLQDKQAKFESSRKGYFSDKEEDDTEEILFKGKNGPRGEVINNLIGSKSMDERIVTLQEANDNIMIVSQLLNVPPTSTKLYHETLDSNPFLKKGLDATNTGQGADWVPTGYSSRLFDRVRLELMVSKLHEELPMPTAIYKPPVVTTDAVGYLIPENTGDNDFVTAAQLIKATNPGTSNFTLTARKIAGRVVFSEELSEDSIIPVLPFVTNNIVLALSQAQETATINGDTSATHQDSDVTTSTDSRKAWDGYRKSSLSTVNASLSTLTGEALTGLRSNMGKYGVRPTSLAIVTSIAGYAKLLNLKDSGSNNLVVTVEKYGAGATILTGELGKVYGIPIIISEYCRQDLNASGVYDGSLVTKTIAIIVYRPGFIFGDRRSMRVKVAEQIQTDQTILVATMRKAFSSVYDATANALCAVGYNM